ncbi:melanotransferrin-like [Sarcophilus harrisii]|uniref:melanotransferrin-like n=1 Tax=Sarcophilus harrisii TaxID=9305 RepID=UPI001301EE58|nr:melanotransferrin-like [Sarcophilus harrisii]
MRTLCQLASLLLSLRAALALSELRWCAISDPEREKCEAMAAAFREAAIQPALRCVLGTSAEHCVRLIQVSAPAPAGNYSLRPLSESARAPGRGSQAAPPGAVGRAPSGPGAVRDGGRAEVTEWRRCHLARVPAHAVVVRADTDGAQVFRMLREGQMRFNHAGASFQMFESEAFGQKNLLFKDSTTELVPIGTQTYQAWLGADYLHAMMGLVCDPDRLPRYLRWCVLSAAEIQKCGDMAVAFSRKQLKPDIQCVAGESTRHCMEQIQAKAADVITLSGGENGPGNQGRAARGEHRGGGPGLAARPRGPWGPRPGPRGLPPRDRNPTPCLARDPTVGTASHPGAPVLSPGPKAPRTGRPGGRGLDARPGTASGGGGSGTGPCWTTRSRLRGGPEGPRVGGGPGAASWSGPGRAGAQPPGVPSALALGSSRSPGLFRMTRMPRITGGRAGRRDELKSPNFCLPQSPHLSNESMRAKRLILAGGRDGDPGEEVLGAGSHPPGPPPADNRKDSYYAVAVVKRNSSYSFTLDELRGKRSCHAGHGTPAGWDIPVGVLVHRGFIRPKGCDILEAVSEFFSASCVPVNNAQDYPPRLCQLCIGDEHGLNKCYGNSQERYYGYSGAFRCLAEGAGDVAFVTHSTVFENTNGHNPEDWAVHLKSEDYELLCPNGARAEVTQFAACNLAQVPAHAVMVHPDTNPFAVYGLLDKAQELFGNDSNKNGFKMFDSSDYHGQDLLFKDSTVRLVPVREKTGPAWPRTTGFLGGPLSPCQGRTLGQYLWHRGLGALQRPPALSSRGPFPLDPVATPGPGSPARRFLRRLARPTHLLPPTAAGSPSPAPDRHLPLGSSVSPALRGPPAEAGFQARPLRNPPAQSPRPPTPPKAEPKVRDAPGAPTTQGPLLGRETHPQGPAHSRPGSPSPPQGAPGHGPPSGAATFPSPGRVEAPGPGPVPRTPGDPRCLGVMGAADPTLAQK